MPKGKSPRKGSLQFWPRKRAAKFLPSTNWDAIKSNNLLKGFIAYKAGMASAFVKDETEHSMSKGKNIVTVLCDTGERYLSTWIFKDFTE